MLEGIFCTRSRGRTGTGVNLLVFETSASTDSAIRASFERANIDNFDNPANFFWTTSPPHNQCIRHPNPKTTSVFRRRAGK